jgi:hypothetical protein
LEPSPPSPPLPPPPPLPDQRAPHVEPSVTTKQEAPSLPKPSIAATDDGYGFMFKKPGVPVVEPPNTAAGTSTTNTVSGLGLMIVLWCLLCVGIISIVVMYCRRKKQRHSKCESPGGTYQIPTHVRQGGMVSGDRFGLRNRVLTTFEDEV